MITEITQGAARARLAPHLGGRVTALRLARAGECLLPFPEDTRDLLHWPKGGIYPLIPYSGRIRDARLGEVALRPHPDTLPHTLHGAAHRRVWRLMDATDAAAGMVLEHAGDAEWPWPFRATMRVVLPTPDCFEISVSLENTGASATPAGLGLHPYFLAPKGCRLRLKAGREWPLDEAVLTGPPPTGALDWDGPVEGPLTRQFSDWGGRAEWGGLTMTASAELAHLVLHRPAGVDWLCLEPASHIIDGFNRALRGVAGTGAVWLEPGQTLSASLTIQA
jgi:aldose 1-epimerase